MHVLLNAGCSSGNEESIFDNLSIVFQQKFETFFAQSPIKSKKSKFYFFSKYSPEQVDCSFDNAVQSLLKVQKCFIVCFFFNKKSPPNYFCGQVECSFDYPENFFAAVSGKNRNSNIHSARFSPNTFFWSPRKQFPQPC